MDYSQNLAAAFLSLPTGIYLQTTPQPAGDGRDRLSVHGWHAASSEPDGSLAIPGLTVQQPRLSTIEWQYDRLVAPGRWQTLLAPHPTNDAVAILICVRTVGGE